MLMKLLIFAVVVVVVFLFLMMRSSKKKGDGGGASSQPDEYIIASYRSGTNYKFRNFIILIVILLAVLGWWFFTNKNLKKNNKALTEEKTKLESELQETHGEIMKKPELEAQLDRIREEVSLNNKVMLKEDTSTKTLEYLFYLADKYGDYMHFDFGLSESGADKDDPTIRYNKYVLTGKAFTNQIFSFIDQLERQPPFYAVDGIALEALPPDQKGKVDFSVELTAYFTDNGTPLNRIELFTGKSRQLAYNPFYPRIHSPVISDDEEFMQLFDLDNGTVVALSPERVFLRNNSSGIIQIFNIGDRVRYGYLESIDWANQQAVFRLNRYGVAESIRLGLNP